MLSDRLGRKFSRQVATPGPHRGNVTSQGRNRPVILQDVFNFAAERKSFFSPTYFSLQFGSQPPDDRTQAATGSGGRSPAASILTRDPQMEPK